MRAISPEAGPAGDSAPVCSPGRGVHVSPEAASAATTPGAAAPGGFSGDLARVAYLPAIRCDRCGDDVFPPVRTCARCVAAARLAELMRQRNLEHAALIARLKQGQPA